MKRLFGPGIVLPLLLAVAGVALIVAGQLHVDGPGGESLPPIPNGSGVAVGSASPSGSVKSVEPTPSRTPIPDTWVAVQIEVPSVDLNVAVKRATAAEGGFPPDDAAYILYASVEPGRGGNTYIVGHALQHIFKRLWNVTLGAEVRILMSDGKVLRYVVTEVRPNISCPDTRVAPHPNPPLALQYAPPGCPGAKWIRPTDHQRLTLQTSQGFNRNWGELIIIARPIA
ncbi:MAG: class F sortase [Chloroflexota bacterium]